MKMFCSIVLFLSAEKGKLSECVCTYIATIFDSAPFLLLFQKVSLSSSTLLFCKFKQKRSLVLFCSPCSAILKIYSKKGGGD